METGVLKPARCEHFINKVRVSVRKRNRTPHYGKIARPQAARRSLFRSFKIFVGIHARGRWRNWSAGAYCSCSYDDARAAVAAAAATASTASVAAATVAAIGVPL